MMVGSCPRCGTGEGRCADCRDEHGKKVRHLWRRVLLEMHASPSCLVYTFRCECGVDDYSVTAYVGIEDARAIYERSDWPKA